MSFDSAELEDVSGKFSNIAEYITFFKIIREEGKIMKKSLHIKTQYCL
jgi:hypothetical protein